MRRWYELIALRFMQGLVALGLLVGAVMVVWMFLITIGVLQVR